MEIRRVPGRWTSQINQSCLQWEEGIFEYIIQQTGNNIQMRVRLKFNTAFFPNGRICWPSQFFAFIVKKESEQIVFKELNSA